MIQADKDIQVWDCSPCVGGNSQALQQAVIRGLGRRGFKALGIALRDYQLCPCQGCQACRQGPCIFSGCDSCESLFSSLQSAALACFVAPIYFYHLPAPFKALIDRSQGRYARGQDDRGPVPRPAFALLHSGRLKGQRLFAGSILTLRYFLYPFGFRLALVQTLRGMDDRDLKVAENEVVDQDVFELVQQMARAMAGSGRG